MTAPTPIRATVIDPRVLQAVQAQGLDGVAVAHRAMLHARTSVILYTVAACLAGAIAGGKVSVPIPHLDYLVVALIFAFGWLAAFRAYLASEMEIGGRAFITFVTSPILWTPEFF